MPRMRRYLRPAMRSAGADHEHAVYAPRSSASTLPSRGLDLAPKAAPPASCRMQIPAWPISCVSFMASDCDARRHPTASTTS